MAYHSKTDVEQVFGTINVGVWADKDRDGNATTIAARIAQGILIGDNIIDEYLQNTQYKIPIQDQDGNVPVGITNLAATFHGIWLYTTCGIDHSGVENGKHALSNLEERAYKELFAYKDGTRIIKDAV